MLCFTCENALKRIARKPSVHYLVKLKWCWLVYGAEHWKKHLLKAVYQTTINKRTDEKRLSYNTQTSNELEARVSIGKVLSQLVFLATFIVSIKFLNSEQFLVF